MNRAASTWVSPLIALLVMGMVCVQTLAALRESGAFGWHTSAPRVAVSPAYASLDRAIDRHDPRFTLRDLRDPFEYSHASAAPVDHSQPPASRHKPVPVMAAEVPVLTAIVWDNDPRALVRWHQREWTVRQGGLFDEFQVVDISRDQVTLRRGDETLVLHRRNPGE